MKPIRIYLNFALNFVHPLRFVYSQNIKKEELLEENIKSCKATEVSKRFPEIIYYMKNPKKCDLESREPILAVVSDPCLTSSVRNHATI